MMILKQFIIFFCMETVIQVAYMAPSCGPPQCESIKADLCTSLDNNYSLTKFPTKRFLSQDDALLQFNTYSSLVRSNCSAKLARFLCSYYFPPCLGDSCTDIEVGPCQGLCLEVQRDCQPILIAYNHTWNFDCSELSPTQPCIDAPSKPSPSPTTLPPINSCEAINNSVCTSFHPNYYKTFFPNAKFNSREDADLHFQSFGAFVNHNCSDKLKLLLCSSHYPVCLPGDNNTNSEVKVLYPCKHVCKQVKRNCEPLLQQYNTSWPDLLDCNQFPSKRDEHCIDEIPEDPPTTVVSTTTTVSASPTPTDIGTCEPIDSRVQSVCGVLNKNYTLTRFPHGEFNTQNEAYEEFVSYLPNVKSNCSAELLALLCYYYFPSCSPDKDEVKVPCKAICRKARKGCETCFKNNNLDWPDHFNCDKNFRVNKNCISLKDIDKYTRTFSTQTC